MPANARLALIALAVTAGAACLQADETVATGNTNIVIGLLVPPEEPSAASLRDGATLGVEQANKFAGPPIRLVIRGRTGQWGADGVEAARMVTDDGAQGLIAPPDGAATHLVLQVSGRTSVPVISLCGDSSVTQTGVRWMARIVPCTVDEAKTLFTGIHVSHWTVLIPEGRVGREVARDLKAAATDSRCTINKMIEVSTSLTNATEIGKQVLASRPDAVLLWLDPAKAGAMAKALHAAGFTGTMAGPSRLRSAAGGAIEGLVVTDPILEKEAATAYQTFTDSFRERFGHEPDATATASYDATVLLIHILRLAGDHPSHDSFPIVFSIPGASGVLTLDSQGNRKVNLQMLKVQNGRFISFRTGTNE